MKNQKSVNDGANESVTNPGNAANSGGKAIKIESKNNDANEKKKKGLK